MTQMISTTIPDEIYNIAKEKHIKWSDALRVGILKLSNTSLPPMKGELFESKEQQMENIIKHRDILMKQLKEYRKNEKY